MSRNSRDFYHSSSSRSQHETLPSIREVVGDVLEQPVRPASRASSVYQSTHRTSTPRPPANITTRAQQPTTPVLLPPMQPSRSGDPAYTRYGAYSPSPMRGQAVYSSSSRPTDSAQSHYTTQSSSSSRSYYNHSPSPRPPQVPARQEYPSQRPGSAHSYDVFVASGDSLVHKRSSSRDDFHQVTKEDTISNSTGKHVCPECGRRFEKLSTLKNHLTTHSGERPYVCPDCGKPFSVSSNMRRHQLTHRAGSSSERLRD